VQHITKTLRTLTGVRSDANSLAASHYSHRICAAYVKSYVPIGDL
jgi:hypothetical protein